MSPDGVWACPPRTSGTRSSARPALAAGSVPSEANYKDTGSLGQLAFVKAQPSLAEFPGRFRSPRVGRVSREATSRVAVRLGLPTAASFFVTPLSPDSTNQWALLIYVNASYTHKTLSTQCTLTWRRVLGCRLTAFEQPTAREFRSGREAHPDVQRGCAPRTARSIAVSRRPRRSCAAWPSRWHVP